MKYTELSLYKARKIARQYAVRLPRVGYEVSLGNGSWLSSTGHFQFGWFGLSVKTPFVLKEREE